jgi:periplasmic divalent cation tolerance protein
VLIYRAVNQCLPKTRGRIYKVLWFVNKKAQYGVNMSHYLLCLVTIDDPAKAAEIARALVERKLAACVNIVTEVRSIYRWEGEICDDSERLMFIKTTSDLFPRLQTTVKELHPYDVPEIISLKIDQGLPEYLQWIDESTRS